MKIILIGKTATGKDTIANELCKRYGYKLAKSHTTRPKRDREGNTHHFISEEEYAKYNPEERLAETTINGYHYFLTPETVEESDIIIVEPKGLNALIDYFVFEVFLIFYIDADEEKRKKAYEKRGSHVSFEERTKAENKRFQDLNHTLQVMKNIKLDTNNSYRLHHLLERYFNHFNKESLNDIVESIHETYELLKNLKQKYIEIYNKPVRNNKSIIAIYREPKQCQQMLFDMLKPKEMKQ